MGHTKTTAFDLDDKFFECCFTLSEEDILTLDKGDNGAITNVIAGIDHHCFGVKLYDDHLGLAVDMFYINGSAGLKGDIVQLSLADSNYFALLLRFCVVLANEYADLNELDAFNTFQKKLRGFLEKLGFFTTTNLELKQFKGQSIIMMSSSKRGVFKLEFIDKTEYYRSFFGDSFATELIVDRDYVYLMLNVQTSLIKIGTSKNPGYRERTLHSQEPEIHLIAKWCCPKQIERKLHAKFKHKSSHGEWFRLNLSNLAEIETFMNEEIAKPSSDLDL